MVSKPTSCRCCCSPLGPQDSRFSGTVSPPQHRSRLEVLPKPQHPTSRAHRCPERRPSTLTPGLCTGWHSGVKPRLWGTAAQAREEEEPPHFCRQLRPACPVELSPMPTAFKDSCLPPCPHRGLWGVSAPRCSASPLTSLLNSFHQLHQQRWCNLRRAELLLQVWERKPWRRGRERRGQPQLSTQTALEHGQARAQPMLLPTAASKSEESCREATAHVSTAWRPRGTCELAQKPVQHLLTPALPHAPDEVCTEGTLMLPAGAGRQNVSPWGPQHPQAGTAGVTRAPGAQAGGGAQPRNLLVVVSCD